MGKHQRVSEHSLRTRTVIGGALVSGALIIGAPAGMALAGPTTSSSFGNKATAVSKNGPLSTPAQRGAFVQNVQGALLKTEIGQKAFGAIAANPKLSEAVNTAIGKFIAGPPTKSTAKK